MLMLWVQQETKSFLRQLLFRNSISVLNIFCDSYISSAPKLQICALSNVSIFTFQIIQMHINELVTMSVH
uniref:Uncharacterized protein n=1 Tax=Anguilla anguilla TaxID=7936 RepID=A0A0E9WRB5_ANGAN